MSKVCWTDTVYSYSNRHHASPESEVIKSSVLSTFYIIFYEVNSGGFFFVMYWCFLFMVENKVNLSWKRPCCQIVDVVFLCVFLCWPKIFNTIYIHCNRVVVFPPLSCLKNIIWLNHFIWQLACHVLSGLRDLMFRGVIAPTLLYLYISMCWLNMKNSV